jgi:hypothetical protein
MKQTILSIIIFALGTVVGFTVILTLKIVLTPSLEEQNQSLQKDPPSRQIPSDKKTEKPL